MRKVCKFILFFTVISLLSIPEALPSDTTGFQSAFNKAKTLSRADPDSALTYAREAFRLSLQTNIDSLIILSKNLLGDIYFSSGNYHLALEYYFKSLEKLEEKTLTDMTPGQLRLLLTLNSHITNCYFYLDMPEQSYEYSRRCNGLIDQIEQLRPGVVSDLVKMYITFNIGSLYIDAKNIDLAKEHMDKVAVMNASLKDSLILRDYYNNMGIIYKEKGMMDSALANYQKALAINELFNSLTGMARAHNNMGEYYKLLGDNERAISHFTRAREKATQASAWLSVKIANESLSTVYEEMGKWDQAYYFLKEARRLDEEVLRSNDREKYSRLAMQYDYEKDFRTGMLQQSITIKKERSHKIIFILISVVLFMIIVTIIISTRNLHNKARLAAIEREVRELEAAMLKQEREKMQQDLEFKDRQLAEKALNVVQKNEFIASVADQLVQIRKNLPDQCGDLLDNLEMILRRDSGNAIWKEFEMRFREVHAQFYQALNNRFPHLTPGEKKLASLLRLNLSTKEISAITYQSPDSIKVARSRLRKKLGLAPEEDVISFLEKMR